MKTTKQLAVVVSSGIVVALSGVVIAAGNSSRNQFSTSLQNTTGNGALFEELSQPNSSLSVAVESTKKPNINFNINGQNIPTDKPGVTPFSQTTPDGGMVSGQVVTSGTENSGNVNINLSGQNSSYNVSTTVTPGNNINSNQTTTTTFNNSSSNFNSSSFSSSSNYNSSTTYSNGHFQQSP